MTATIPTLLSACRTVTRLGVAVTALTLALIVAGASSPRLSRASALATAGTAQIITPRDGTAGTGGLPLSTGGSATKFSLLLPSDAACTGDSANDGYRVQSYIVPVGDDPAALRFDEQGPIPFGFGAALRQPLYAFGGSPMVNAQTANATTPPGPGPVINIPAFDFAVFGPGEVGPGRYNVGIACTKGAASDTQLDKYWNTGMEIAASTADTPAGITWTATVSQATSTTTTPPGATTTTPPGATTTTPPGATTTTRATTAAAGSNTTVPGTPLARAGSGTISLVAGALVLLVLGRMAVLVTQTAQARAGRPR